MTLETIRIAAAICCLRGGTSPKNSTTAIMATILRCLFSPRLFRTYQDGSNPGGDYMPNIVEKTSDYIIKWFRFCWSFSCWTSPVLLIIFYRRGVFTPEGLVSVLSYGTTFSIVLTAAVCVRALGRRTNQEYTTFLGRLKKAREVMNLENKEALSRHDFEFFAWPVEFQAKMNNRISVVHTPRPRGIVERIRALPCQVLSYLAIHTFGRRLVYPGATALLQMLVGPMLTQGRTKLVEENRGVRFKLSTIDKNEIDCMFVDRRNNPQFPKGDTLVICCEGNAGFYEIGTMVTALEAGYSVIGWNHPGYWGSTGAPFPSQEQNAADAVMQLSKQRLGFQEYDIMIFGWSIGGYPVSWLAMNYPEVQSVVVDASFDDIVPLAEARMPQSWKTLVRLTMKKYMNLNIAEQLCKYPGPVLLIRRSRDEMITTIDPTIRSSNRGNYILHKLLLFRYPKVVAEDTYAVLTQWLATDPAGQADLLAQHEVDEGWCNSILQTYIEENSRAFPLLLGEDLQLEERKQLTLFLASKYMEEFDATHCQPLPANYLRPPWSVEFNN